jgi:hypothetical protein
MDNMQLFEKAGRYKTIAKIIALAIILAGLVPNIMMKARLDYIDRKVFLAPLHTDQFRVVSSLKPALVNASCEKGLERLPLYQAKGGIVY